MSFFNKILGRYENAEVDPVISGSKDEITERVSSPITRYGMYRNFRVGKIKYISRDFSRILLHVHEETRVEEGRSDSLCTYNWWITVDEKFAHYIRALAHVGDWCLVGVYIQSFFVSKESGHENVLRLRFYNPLANESEAKSTARLIMDSVTPIDHPLFYYEDVNKKKYETI